MKEIHISCCESIDRTDNQAQDLTVRVAEIQKTLNAQPRQVWLTSQNLDRDGPNRMGSLSIGFTGLLPWLTDLSITKTSTELPVQDYSPD